MSPGVFLPAAYALTLRTAGSGPGHRPGMSTHWTFYSTGNGGLYRDEMGCLLGLRIPLALLMNGNPINNQFAGAADLLCIHSQSVGQ